MLANEHIHAETEYMESVREKIKDEYQKASLKGLILIVKLLHNIRTNMVVTMKHEGISLVEPKKENKQ